MFGKLMNYELRYNVRLFAPMWAVVMVLCILTRIAVPMGEDVFTFIEGNRALAAAIVIGLTAAAISIMVVLNFVVILQRYSKGLFGDEGYLMFTLPVTTWQLVHAKALTAVLMVVITVAVTVLGVVVASSHNVLWDQIGYLYGSLLYANDVSTASVALYAFWGILSLIAAVAQGIYMIYLAITMGQMWKKHPVVGAIIAYFAIEAVVSSAQYAIEQLLGGMGSGMQSMMWLMESEGAIGLLAVMAYMIVKCVVLVLIFSYLSKVLLEKRLELQ